MIPKYLEIVYDENDVAINQLESESSPQLDQCNSLKVVETQPYEIPISGILVVGNNNNQQTILPRPPSSNSQGESGSSSLHHTIDIPNCSISNTSNSNTNNISNNNPNTSSNFSSLISNQGIDDSLQTLLPTQTLNSNGRNLNNKNG